MSSFVPLFSILGLRFGDLCELGLLLSFIFGFGSLDTSDGTLGCSTGVYSALTLNDPLDLFATNIS